jgi:hypothetical protein
MSPCYCDFEGLRRIPTRHSGRAAAPSHRALSGRTRGHPAAGDQWLHEVKLDGCRMFYRKQGMNAQFLSRKAASEEGRAEAVGILGK